MTKISTMACACGQTEMLHQCRACGSPVCDRCVTQDELCQECKQTLDDTEQSFHAE